MKIVQKKPWKTLDFPDYGLKVYILANIACPAVILSDSLNMSACELLPIGYQA